MTDKSILTENAYNQNIEQYVEQGIPHPMLVEWHKQDPAYEPEVAEPVSIKHRYQICKTCDKFDNLFKKCQVCNCFMPIKTQFKIFKCPQGKW
jgi:hypothetical protein